MEELPSRKCVVDRWLFFSDSGKIERAGSASLRLACPWQKKESDLRGFRFRISWSCGFQTRVPSGPNSLMTDWPAFETASFGEHGEQEGRTSGDPMRATVAQSLWAASAVEEIEDGGGGFFGEAGKRGDLTGGGGADPGDAAEGFEQALFPGGRDAGAFV